MQSQALNDFFVLQIKIIIWLFTGHDFVHNDTEAGSTHTHTNTIECIASVPGGST
eukprot:m.182375 g.182375  ORF g.182375 m.182375 type:complete len:55 (+) comp14668_c0_seq2:3560-3724(+)